PPGRGRDPPDRGPRGHTVAVREGLRAGPACPRRGQPGEPPGGAGRVPRAAEHRRRAAARLVARVAVRGRDRGPVGQQVAGHRPADQAALPLARCHELVGQMKEARTLYEKALAAKPDDVVVLRSLVGFRLRVGEMLEAEPLLLSIIRLSIQSPEDAAWARRML